MQYRPAHFQSFHFFFSRVVPNKLTGQFPCIFIDKSDKTSLRIKSSEGRFQYFFQHLVWIFEMKVDRLPKLIQEHEPLVILLERRKVHSLSAEYICLCGIQRRDLHCFLGHIFRSQKFNMGRGAGFSCSEDQYGIAQPDPVSISQFMV